MNTWFSHRKCRCITWHCPDGNIKKIYDFILSCSWIRQYVTNCCVHNSYDFDSYHRLVAANLKTPCSKLARYVKRTKKVQPKQFDLSALKIPEIRNDLKNEAVNEMNSITLEADNSTLNKNLLKSINDAALNNLPKKANVKLYQPWHNDEKLKQLYELKNRLIRENSNASSVKATRNKIRLRAKYLKNEYLKQESSEINQLAVNRKLEQLFKRAKSQSTTLKHAQNSCEVQKLMKHFRTHFNSHDPSKLNTPNELRNEEENLPPFLQNLRDISKNITINDNPPTLEEIQKQIELLKNNKANNDIHPELLKICNEPVTHEIIHHILSNLWENLDVPDSWGNSRLKTIWKNKGSKNDPSKYRGLSIGSTICKLVINIILERLRSWYEAQVSDEQIGFRKDRGTTDGIYTLKRIQQITDRKKQPLFLLFVDLTAAYDHIPRSWLFQSIKMRFQNKEHPRMIDILEQLYKQTSLTFLETDETFETTSGVRQGGPESSFLFNLYIDYIMRVFINESQTENIRFFEHCFRLNPRSISREERLKIRQENLKSFGIPTLPWCGYADDLILFLLELTDLQKATDLLESIFTRFGLNINATKTESMILNHSDQQYPQTIITLKNTALNNVENFKYLRAFIRYDIPNTGDVEINHRIQIAVSKFVDMSNLLQNVKIHLKTRIVFLNNFI